MAKKNDFYALLGLTKDASQDDIRRAYLEAARRLHPDVNLSPDSNEMFIQLQEAYEILSNPSQRKTYDVHLEGDKAENGPVALNVLFSRSATPRIPESQLIYALVDIVSTEGNPQTITPLNLCLVIDRSTSMQGERLDMVKSAAIDLVRQIRREDTLSIVVFSDRAETLVPAGKYTEKEDIETSIRMIRSGGGTEMLRGLEAGLFEVRRGLSRSQINHLILLTDGRTYGDEQACIQQAQQAAAAGVRITTLGIGNEWNDVFLDHLASLTGGTSFYISKLADIRHLLKEKIRALNQVYAEQVNLELETGPGVVLNYIFRLQPDPSPLPLEPTLRLGGLQYASRLSLLLEFVVSPIPEKMHQVYLAQGHAELVIPSRPGLQSKIHVSLSRPVGIPSSAELPPQVLFQALANVILYRLQERARQELEQGKYEEAERSLQSLATNLLNSGQHTLAHQVLMEADHIQRTRAFSEEGDKRIKYGTRALLLPAHIQEAGL